MTISGVKYVIDSGVVKRRVYDCKTGLEALRVRKIARDQAWQRCGRAGRESDGYCYRTYTVNEYNQMESNTTPEILRSNIATTVRNTAISLFSLYCTMISFFTDTSAVGNWHRLQEIRFY